MVEQRVDGDLVAVDDVEDAVGQAGLGVQLGDQFDADGSRSDGLSTNVLPQAIAIGCIHIGTIAGKLNGVMPAHDAERLAEGVGVDVGGDLVGVLALEQLRDAAGELDDLQAADDLALGVVEHLAVLGGMISPASSSVCVDQLAEREHHARAARQRRLAPLSNAVLGGGDGGVDVGASASSDLGLLLAGGRVPDRRGAGRGPGVSLPPIQCWMVFTRWSSGLTSLWRAQVAALARLSSS